MIRIEGDQAYVQSYYRAYERLPGKDGSPRDLTMYGRYLDRMEKRDGEWRIAERKVQMDWWRRWDDWPTGIAACSASGSKSASGARRTRRTRCSAIGCTGSGSASLQRVSSSMRMSPSRSILDAGSTGMSEAWQMRTMRGAL